MSIPILPVGVLLRNLNPLVSQEDPQRTVQTFIDLVQRHEQSFYTFVHNVHSKGQGLFDSLMSWIELFLSYARDGLPRPIDLEFILPHAGPERVAIMTEVDAVAQYHYRLKIAHEEKVRRRFNQNGGMPDGQEVEEAALLDSVMASLSIGETVVGDAGELGDEESEDGDEGDDDQDQEDGSEGSSIRSARVHVNVTAPPTPANPPTPSRIQPATPEMTAVTDLPFLSPNGAKEKEKDRRGSGSGCDKQSRSSMEKIRSSLHRPHSEERKEKKSDEKRPPPPRTHQRGQAGKRARKARRLATEELMVPPETKALEELRPLFVEIVSAVSVFRGLRMLIENR